MPTRPAPLVLLVFSHPDLRDLYSYGLTAAGCRVATAGSVAAAHDVAAKLSPVAVILEVSPASSLPAGDWRPARRHGAEPAVIGLMSVNLPEIRRRAERAGIHVLLHLPCLPDELVRAVRRVTSLPAHSGQPARSRAGAHRAGGARRARA